MSLPMPATSAPRAVCQKEARPRSTLERVEAIEIPHTHPVRFIADIYDKLRQKCEPQHLPAFDARTGTTKSSGISTNPLLLSSVASA